MARKNTGRRGSSTDPVPTFDEEYLDVDHWPHRWTVEQRDLQPGERMLDVFKPFLVWLLDQGLSRKTLREHRDNVCTLGAEVIRQLNFHPELRKRTIKQVLTETLNGDDGPLIYPRCSEAEQFSFDVTCRKLHRFLTEHKSTSK